MAEKKDISTYPSAFLHKKCYQLVTFFVKKCAPVLALNFVSPTIVDDQRVHRRV
jgi:hypothetical protein